MRFMTSQALSSSPYAAAAAGKNAEQTDAQRRAGRPATGTVTATLRVRAYTRPLVSSTRTLFARYVGSLQGLSDRNGSG
jgi:hypothetical protein